MTRQLSTTPYQATSRRVGAFFAHAAYGLDTGQIGELYPAGYVCKFSEGDGYAAKGHAHGAPLHSHPKSCEPGEVAFGRMVTALKRMPDNVPQELIEHVQSKAYRPTHGGYPG